MAISSPLVTIVVPVYNRGAIVGETIESVLDQTLYDLELILVDDGSSDNSREVCLEYSAQDSRVLLAPPMAKNRGPGACRNDGARIAKGEYLIFLDSDDLLLPDSLAKRVQMMKAHPQLDFIVYLGEFFEKRIGDTAMLWNIPTNTDPFLRFIGDDVPWQTSGPIWKRESFEKTGGWDEQIVMGDDQELHTRALKINLKYQFSTEIDYVLRRATGSATQLGQQFAAKSAIMSQVLRLRKVFQGESSGYSALGKRERHRLAGSLMLRANQLVEFHADRDGALLIWSDAKSYSLVPWWLYKVGQKYLRHHKSFLGDVCGYFICKLSGADFLLVERACLGVVPRVCASEEHYDGRFHRQPPFVTSPAVTKGLISYLMEKLVNLRRFRFSGPRK